MSRNLRRVPAALKRRASRAGIPRSALRATSWEQFCRLAVGESVTTVEHGIRRAVIRAALDRVMASIDTRGQSVESAAARWYRAEPGDPGYSNRSGAGGPLRIEHLEPVIDAVQRALNLDLLLERFEEVAVVARPLLIDTVVAAHAWTPPPGFADVEVDAASNPIGPLSSEDAAVHAFALAHMSSVAAASRPNTVALWLWMNRASRARWLDAAAACSRRAPVSMTDVASPSG